MIDYPDGEFPQEEWRIYDTQAFEAHELNTDKQLAGQLLLQVENIVYFIVLLVAVNCEERKKSVQFSALLSSHIRIVSD